jgi:ethanolamine-phosphate cytidylyltransferase
MDHFKVDIVCHGQTPIALEGGHHDPYAVPKTMGKFTLLDSGNDMTTDKIVDRIIRHRIDYEERNKKKEKKENDAYEAFQKQKTAQKCG